MREKIHQIREKFKSPELRQLEFDTVRIFPHQINQLEFIEKPLIPTLENLDQFAQKKVRPMEWNYLTSSLWAKKSSSSPAAKEQLHPFGGKQQIKKNTGRLEEPAEAAAREMHEESQIFGILPDDLLPFHDWEHGFNSPDYIESAPKKDKLKHPAKLTYQEKLFWAKVPSFAEPHSYIREDFIESIRKLSWLDVMNLMDQGYLEIDSGRCNLWDSISTNQELREKQQVWTDKSENYIREMLKYFSMHYEAMVLKSLIDTILENSEKSLQKDIITAHKDPKVTVDPASETNPNWHDILTIPNEFIDDVSLEKFLDPERIRNLIITRETKHLFKDLGYFISSARRFLFRIESVLPIDKIDLNKSEDILSPDLINNIVILAGRKQNLLKRRVALIRELRRAYKSLVFKDSLQFIDQAGPQTAFLLARNLVDMQEITPEEYKMLEQFPDFKLLLDTVLKPLQIDTNNRNWYANMIDKLTRYRMLKTKNLTEKMKTNERQEYRQMKKNILLYFAQQTGISVPEIPFYFNGGENYLKKRMNKILEGIVDPLLRAKLNRQLQSQSPSFFDDALLMAFGVGDNRILTSEERGLAWRLIVLTLRNIEKEIIKRKLQEKSSEDLFGTILHSIATRGQPQPLEELGITPDEYTFNYSLPERLKIEYSGKEYEIYLPQHIPVTELVYYRQKDDESLLGKWIERGKISYLTFDPTVRYIDKIRPYADIDDYDGTLFINNLDFDRLWSEILKKNPALIIQRFAPGSKFYETVNNQIKILLTKMLVDAYLQELEKRGFEHEIFKPRFSEYLTVLRPGEEYKGSGASDIKWAWAKFDLKARRRIDSTDEEYVMEIQRYPDLIEAEKKKRNDKEVYSKTRPFVPSEIGYFSEAYILYGIQQEYQELIKRRTESVNIFPGKPGKKIIIHVPNWIKKKVQIN